MIGPRRQLRRAELLVEVLELLLQLCVLMEYERLWRMASFVFMPGTTLLPRLCL